MRARRHAALADGAPAADVRAQAPLARRFDRAAFSAAVRSAMAHAQEIQPAQTPVGTGQGSRESEGDTTHRAFSARGTFHADGTGVKVGVLSDDVCSLAASQASGDLGSVTVLPGQTGTCPGGDEGTAMLEIIHDLAPGAQLYFATAFTGLTNFAQNIRDLRTAGCDIIVDDVFYFTETPFQDGQTVASTTNGGVVIQAVKDVVAAGALYFSSAGNGGHLGGGTSGTWEGDFLDGGLVAPPLPAGTGRLHSFGATTYDTIAFPGFANNLYWSDPLGGSANDYDLFRLNSTGTTVVESSTNIQTGTQDPYEQVSAGNANERLVIVKAASAAGRFLHLGAVDGVLSTAATSGETHGHSATTALNSFGVAATPATTPGPYPNPFTSANNVESFSSDGPRRIFFMQDGTPITPGNVSSTGGQVLNKPDFTAADGTSVTGVGGFGSPFYGTSAAAPHAGAIAALVKSGNPALTATQVRTALFASAIDIGTAGVDKDSGVGIIMAYGALQAAGVTGSAYVYNDTVTLAENPGNGDGFLNPGEGGMLTVPLANLGTATATAVSAALTTSTPGITIRQPNSVSYGALASGASASNSFFFTVASSAPCPMTINFNLTVTYAGGTSPQVYPLQFQTGVYSVTTTLDGTPPPSSPGVTTSTGTQTGRLTRDGITASCASPKATPTLFATTARQYDLYSFNTCSYSAASCITVTMKEPVSIFSLAYQPSFNPASLQTNYKADGGLSGDIVYSFNLAAGAQTFAIDAHEVNPGGGVGQAYTMTLTGVCGGACAPINGVPIAVAKDVTVRLAPGVHTAAVSIENGSSDPNGDPITITQTPPGPYGPGRRNVYLTVTDNKGAASQAIGVVTVIPPNTAGDFDGDGKDDLTVFRSSTGQWFNLKSNAGYSTFQTISWGTSGDETAVGDYDGDGKDDFAVFRPSTGTWFVLESNTNYTTFFSMAWGTSGDAPVAADYDADGKTDLAVFRPSTGQWFLLFSASNYTTFSTVSWGTGGDAAVPGDYDGDGNADLVVFRPSSGTWFVLKSSTNYTTFFSLAWGTGGDAAVPGDYDGDGKNDAAVFRPSTGQWFLLFSASNYTTFSTVSWGTDGDVAVPGDFDGDGKIDVAVFRPSTGVWYVLKSSTNYTTFFSMSWGTGGDTPVLHRP